MRTILYSSFIFLLTLIDITLNAQNSQDSMLNKISESNYSFCYAKINEIDSIPFLKVEGFATSIISEELVFAFDFEIDNTIEEIDEGIVIEYSYCNEAVNIKGIELSVMVIMPLAEISNEMGVEFYGVISR